jgi:glycosyltransferase involved in cell wall biosynthesis
MGEVVGMGSFREILVLGIGRSGSNLLCAILEKLEGNADYKEIFLEGRTEGLKKRGEIWSGVAGLLGVADDDRADENLVAARDADQLAFFEALSATTAKAGFQSMSCKIFCRQTSIPNLEKILQRPGLGVIFLTRKRIDRHISAMKAKITTEYIKKDTTELKPRLDVRAFLKSSFQIDEQIEAMYRSVRLSGVPCTFLSYERDIDVPAEWRLQRIAQSLKAIGHDRKLPDAEASNWTTKQDLASNWRDKIENGWEAAAALAGLGLLDYAEDGPLEHLLPDAPLQGPASVSAVAEVPRDDTLLDRYSNFALVSADPVITFSAIDNDRSYLAEWMAEHEKSFGSRPGLHFLKPTWSMETSPLEPLIASLRRAEERNPDQQFILLHMSNREAERYRAHGRRSIDCNASIFTDEGHFANDAAPHPRLQSRDAIYIARFEAWKNHWLASGLEAPLFVYAEPQTDESRTCMADIARLCPTAEFVNHKVGNGAYQYLERAELSAVMSRAQVGLALSTVEGFMRSSVECLLAGLPVVSVPSSGSRDRLYTADTALIVEPSPEAVAGGVAQMRQRRLARAEVRRAALSIIREDRKTFRSEVNAVIQAQFGPLAPTFEIEPLLDFTIRYKQLSSFLADIQ